MSVADVKAKTPKSTRAKKVTADEQATVKAALDAAPLEHAPLSAFVMSPLNARTIPYSAESVESLAATIKSVGLLQNLVAHALPDGQLAVAAGGRRLTALNLLRSQQVLTPDHPVAFKRVSEDMAALVSYIENAQRSDMHAAEQIASFGTQAAQGKTAEQIGAEAGYSTRHVQRMLKLANLAPSLLKLLADDKLTVEQCQVLCLEDDQERQVSVYESVKAGWPELPLSMLKKQITDKEISVTDRRFLFVGREAYENAGGVVREDLFSQQEGDGTADIVLLEKLTVQKLEAMAQEIQAQEGWKWSMGRMKSLWPHGDGLEYRLTDEPAPVYVGEEEKRIEELFNKLEYCSENNDEDGYSAASDEIDAIEQAAQIRAWTPETRATTGVVVGFNAYGELCVDRGVIRLADIETVETEESRDAEQPQEPQESTAETSGASRYEYQSPPDEAEGISLPLLTKMSSERTLAVQAALMQQQKKAIALLTWQLCRNVFSGGYTRSRPFRISLTESHSTLTGNAPSGENGAAFLALTEERQRLKALLPQEWARDFTTFFTLNGETLMALMTFCVACSVDGVQTRECGHTSRSQLIELEAALGFNLRDWWQPTKAGFFADLKHTQIIDALNEAGLTGAARDAQKMKKGDAAELAENRMRDTRWVPAWMKGPEPEKATDDAAASEADSNSDNTDPAHAA
ncbi:ParB/RepB/Spo0J family partition protein [Pantoea stewartii]|uniref:ParB/RepB/Spo0J family partition protein n=1 Tax=Pantoea stewartii TaxID=66269 RepID=UPI00162353CB|nr:ParB/RepB/Spo0J family partition protein [Pantoea stewartii]MBC0856477.1 ParB/RepB/Spo0J family partition protein [Pantoea stewartii]